MTARLRAATAALALTALLVGCTGVAAEPSQSPPVAPSPSAPASPSPSTPPSTPTLTPDPSARVIDTTAWLDFTTDDGTIAFRYPADWRLDAQSEFFSPDGHRDDVDDPYERWMDSATLVAPNGQQLLQMADFVDVGGWCDVARPLEMLASEPFDSPGLAGDTSTVLATLALGTADGRWRVGIGLVNEEQTLYPEACRVYFTFSASDGGVSMGTHFQLDQSDDPLWTVDTLDDARAYMQTAEYATIIEILRSVEVAS